MNSLYQELGGEPIVRQISKKFYEIMDQWPEAKTIRDLHPADLSTSEEKLFMFLSGWLGGPQLYQEKIGHPMLRARHMPFKIGKNERDLWILCMTKAFEECQIAEPFRSELLHAFLKIADHMRNQPESTN